MLSFRYGIMSLAIIVICSAVQAEEQSVMNVDAAVEKIVRLKYYEGKASVVYFFSGDKWLELSGAD